jgi:hypothetical protein
VIARSIVSSKKPGQLLAAQEADRLSVVAILKHLGRLRPFTGQGLWI